MNVSIRTRLTAWFTAALFFAMVLLCLLLFWGLKRSINATTDRELQGRLASITGFMRDSIPTLPPGELQDEFKEQSSLGGDLVQVKAADGDWIFQPAALKSMSSELDKAVSDQRGLQNVAIGEKTYRVITDRVSVNGRVYVVQIVADISEFTELLRNFKWLALILIPFTMLMAWAGGYWLSGRALSPVSEITRKARSINAANLSSRLELPANQDELHRLSATLNEMLDRIEHSFTKVQQFSSDASHELRTPIALMRTTAELALNKDRDSDAYRDALRQILAESERTTDLIEDLLSLARSGTAAQLPLVPTDLAAIARKCCTNIAPLAAEKKIDSGLAINFSPASIQGNAESLERLLLIVLDNAIKYSHPNGRIFTKIEQNGSFINVVIEDSGIGIAEDDIPRIFERFYRADKARSRDSGGAGLGLSIAKWIAEMHSAEISVESKLGQGSSFLIRFPKDREK
jgi:heavy metal sensor kinase